MVNVDILIYSVWVWLKNQKQGYCTGPAWPGCDIPKNFFKNLPHKLNPLLIAAF